MKALITLLLTVTVFTDAQAEARKVAKVSKLRGDVEALTMGKTTKLSLNDWVEDGAMVKTSPKSFVQLLFTDRSQMNIGPESVMKLEKYGGKESGVIDLVKGKIRSQVTPDPLQAKDRSKLFIKTPNAVMGIRGTDFLISTNGKNTSTVLFHGEVVFNKLDRTDLGGQTLEQVVSAGVRIQPGDFSIMDSTRTMPTVPARLNVQQLEVLEKNGGYEGERSPDSAPAEASAKSIVPAGLSGATVSSTSEVLKTEVARATAEGPKTESASARDPDGYVAGEKVKPANGSFVHLESGTIIPPGPGSVLDANTNSYIAGPDGGKVGSDGSYVPPKNVEITNDGKILVSFTDKSGQVKVQQVQAPPPVLAAGGAVSLGQVGSVLAANPAVLNPQAPVTNDILNKNFVPSGLTDLSNFQRNQTGGISNVNESASTRKTSDVTITVTPVP